MKEENGPVLETNARRPSVRVAPQLRYVLILVAYLAGIYLLSSIPDVRIMAGVARIAEISERVGIYWLSSLLDPGAGGGGHILPFPEARGGNAVIRLALDLSHIPLFAGLAFFFLRALSGEGAGRQVTMRLCVLVFLATAVLAAVDEWHQSFVPGREPRVKDFLLDLLGSGGMLLILRYRARRRTRLTHLREDRRDPHPHRARSAAGG